MNEQKTNKNIFTFFLTFLTSFLLGFYISPFFHFQDSNNTPKNILEEIVSNNSLNLSNFWKVNSIIQSEFYGIDEVEKKEMEYGIIKGLVNSLGDKFSEFMTPEETKQFTEALSGDFEGIGAVVDKHELGIVVDRVIKGSPALEAGVLKGDIVIEANGEKLQDLNVTQAVNHIKGPAGSKVTLKILRSGESDFLIKEITRQKITIPSVETEIFEKDQMGYISLNMFGDHSSQEFEEALLSMNREDIQGVIIDLRDNGGGYLQSAVEILSHFIEKGNVLVTTKYANSLQDDVYYSENFGKIFDKKLVVLVNGNSASASEITAGALKDYKKAILVGEKTYGKGSVQQPFDMEDGSLLKLTIAKWYTPKDVSIDHNGIDPDISVEFEREDYENKYDRQKEMAKTILKEFMKLDSIALTVDKFQTQSGTVNSEK